MKNFIRSWWLAFLILFFCLTISMTESSMAQPIWNMNGTSNQLSKRMQAVIANHIEIISELARSPLIVQSVIEQNKKKTSLAVIKKIDKDWLEGKNNDFAMKLQTNPAGTFLRNVILENKNIYVEMFLCDDQGAVVGEYPQTTDYWQGDEDKFIKSFNHGNGVVYIGPIEFDQSTKTNSVQISVPVADNGKTIGVLIVGLINIK